MATKLKRISFYADEYMVELLKGVSAKLGAPVSELVRRCVRLTAYADAQTKIETRQSGPETR